MYREVTALRSFVIHLYGRLLESLVGFRVIYEFLNTGFSYLQFAVCGVVYPYHDMWVIRFDTGYYTVYATGCDNMVVLF